MFAGTPAAAPSAARWRTAHAKPWPPRWQTPTVKGGSVPACGPLRLVVGVSRVRESCTRSVRVRPSWVVGSTDRAPRRPCEPGSSLLHVRSARFKQRKADGRGCGSLSVGSTDIGRSVRAVTLDRVNRSSEPPIQRSVNRAGRDDDGATEGPRCGGGPRKKYTVLRSDAARAWSTTGSGRALRRARPYSWSARTTRSRASSLSA